jgi:hypothetical protein
VASDVVVDVRIMLQKTVSYGKNVNLSLIIHKNERYNVKLGNQKMAR